MLRLSTRWLTQQAPIKIIECPRDAMQGLKNFVPTEAKIRFISSLLKVGYDTVDFGSFVSAPAVPQMADTAKVLEALDITQTKSKLLVVVCNQKGAQEAIKHDKITYVGYPLSVSETFQVRNTKRTIETALKDVAAVTDVVHACKKEMVVYISMGFGNPYGDPYSTEMVADLVEKVAAMGVRIISLADTVGVADVPTIQSLYTTLIPKHGDVEFGAHFHSGAISAEEKITSALDAGVRRFDTALGGMGGCPFAKSTLVGNISTESLVDVLKSRDLPHGLDEALLKESNEIKLETFGVGLKELVLASVLQNERYLLDLCLRHFNAADTEGVGFLNRDQFYTGLKLAYEQLGEEVPSEAKLRKKFDQANIGGGDDRITFDEYMLFVRKGLQKREAQQRTSIVQ